MTSRMTTSATDLCVTECRGLRWGVEMEKNHLIFKLHLIFSFLFFSGFSPCYSPIASSPTFPLFSLSKPGGETSWHHCETSPPCFFLFLPSRLAENILELLTSERDSRRDRTPPCLPLCSSCRPVGVKHFVNPLFY